MVMKFLHPFPTLPPNIWWSSGGGSPTPTFASCFAQYNSRLYKDPDTNAPWDCSFSNCCYFNAYLGKWSLMAHLSVLQPLFEISSVSDFFSGSPSHSVPPPPRPLSALIYRCHLLRSVLTPSFAAIHSSPFWSLSYFIPQHCNAYTRPQRQTNWLMLTMLSSFHFMLKCIKKFVMHQLRVNGFRTTFKNKKVCQT